MADLAAVDQLAREVADLQRRLLSLRLALTADLEAGTADSGPLAFLECSAARSRLAVPLVVIDEAVLMCHLTALPEAPPWVRGILDYRGEPVVVLDLAVRLEGDPRAPNTSDIILVCHEDQHRVGLVVEAVGEIFDLDPLDVQPVAPGLPHARFVMGVRSGPAGTTLLLRLSSLLATSGVAELRP